MTDDLPDLPEDDDALAAEYVLRLLDPVMHQLAARRAAEEPDFAARVRDWEARLSPLAEDLDPVPPRAATRARVMDAVGGKPTAPNRRWWLGAGLGLATLAALLVVAPLPMLRGPALQATLASADGALQLSATVSGERLRIARVSGGPRAGRALELWLIADGAPTPVSLGVLPEADVTDIALSSDLAAQLPGATLAVSDEPPGGSPIGAPTGDVLAAAPLVAL